MPAQLLAQVEHAHKVLALLVRKHDRRHGDAARSGKGAAREVGVAVDFGDLEVRAGLAEVRVRAQGLGQRVGEDVGVYGGGFGVGGRVEGQGLGVCGGCMEEGEEVGVV